MVSQHVAPVSGAVDGGGGEKPVIVHCHLGRKGRGERMVVMVVVPGYVL